MNISLTGWINRIKDLFYDLEKTINTIRKDYKGEIFDELQENKQSAGIRAIGFMEDMNNIFVGLEEAKTDEEKIKWANNIKELLCIDDELQYIKSDRTLLKKQKEKNKLEQVPESFSELKKLCKDLTDCAVEENYIQVFGCLVGSNILFCADGAIMINTDCCFAEKVSYDRMWNIIKNLIGE